MTMTVEQRQSLEQEAQAKINDASTRRLGHLEAITKQFSLVSGTDRTEAACVLGKLITDSLCEEKGIETKKKWLAEMSKQICGTYCDDRKLMGFILLHHVSLRIPSLKTMGLSWSSKCIQAIGARLDWKAVTDDMSSQQIERANEILPLLQEGTDGIGRNAKGNPDRAEWMKIIKHYITNGSIPTPEAKQEASAEPEASAEQVQAVTAIPTLEAIATCLENATVENLLAIAGMLSLPALERLSDAMNPAIDAKIKAMQS